MITVRKTRPSDNEALIDIQRRSPQGVDFVLGTDSSPDYFNRTMPYANGHVFVAEEDGQVVRARKRRLASDAGITARSPVTAFSRYPRR